MRFEEIDMENEGIVFVPTDELARLGLQEFRFAVFERTPGRESAAVGSGRSIGFVIQVPQKPVVVASGGPVTALTVIFAVTVLDGDPLLEPMLREDLIAQVPFPHIGGPIIRIIEQFRKTGSLLREWDVVGDTPVRVRPQTGQYRGSRGGADRLCAIGSPEDRRFGGEFVEVGGVDPGVPVNRHRVRPLFIGPQE